MPRRKSWGAPQSRVLSRTFDETTNRETLILDCGHSQIQAPRKTIRERAVCHTCMVAAHAAPAN